MENYKEELTSLKEELTSLKEELNIRIDAVIAKIEKPKFEVGKWYKEPKTKLLLYPTKIKSIIDDVTGYGFDCDGNWLDECEDWGLNDCIEATPKEVEEALTKEAVKRGFKIGTKYYSAKYDDGTIGDSKALNWRFCEETNTLYMNGGNGIVFHNGTWAEIIKTKTIEEISMDLVKLKYLGEIKEYLIKEKTALIETLNNL